MKRDRELMAESARGFRPTIANYRLQCTVRRITPANKRPALRRAGLTHLAGWIIEPARFLLKERELRFDYGTSKKTTQDIEGAG